MTAPSSPSQRQNVAAVVSLTCGIASVLTLGALGFVAGPAAIISGVIGRNAALQKGGRGRAVATWGIVLGVVGTLLFLLTLATAAWVFTIFERIGEGN